MPYSTTLGTLKIGKEPITIELTELDGQARVTIIWPKNALSISSRRFPDFAASITRLFANASIELARARGRGL